MRHRDIENSRLAKLWSDNQGKLRESRARHNAILAKLHIASSKGEIDEIFNNIEADETRNLQADDGWHFATNDIPSQQELTLLGDEVEYKKARWALMKTVFENWLQKFDPGITQLTFRLR
jgi:hypothetical protein